MGHICVSAALSGKSNQCNALYLQINLILCTRHTLFVPSHQYKYTTFILSTGFVFMFKLPETTCFQQAGWKAYGLSPFFHILNDRRICCIYGHRQKCLRFAPMHCSLGGWKMTGNATNFAIQIFVKKTVL